LTIFKTASKMRGVAVQQFNYLFSTFPPLFF